MVGEPARPLRPTEVTLYGKLARAAARVWVGAALALIFSGCWGTRFARMPSYTEETRADVMDLTAANEELKARLAAVEAELKIQTELLRGLKAESASDLGALRERIEEFDERSATPPPQSSRPAAPPEGRAAAAESVAAGGGPDPRAQYDAAYLALLKGNYDLAIAAFGEFVEKNPDSDLADNAQYWIGESHFARDEIGPAVDAFAAVESRWPNGDKVPGALLKIAACHEKEGNTAGARRTYEDLVARFPRSEEARLAKEKMARLR